MYSSILWYSNIKTNEMDVISELEKVKSCSTQFVLAINDTLNVISGKWKLPIIGSLL